VLVIDVPTDALFQLALAPVEDGGFAGLVFLVCRAADDPQLYVDFFQGWSSIHDLTGRYLAVITPMPDAGIVVAGPFAGGVGYAVRDMQLFGESARLQRRSSRAVRMDNSDPVPRAFSAPVMPRDEQAHRSVVTRNATELQEFFGISESFMPCAVIVAPQERVAFAVQLANTVTMYGLLKQLKVAMEPAVTRINQAEGELADARQAWHRGQRALQELAEAQEWSESRHRLARQLTDAAAQVDSDAAQLCDWMSSRLRRDVPLTADEDARGQQLLALLHGKFGALSIRERRRLLRGLRRALNGLNQADPAASSVADPTEDDLRAAEDRVAADHEVVRRLQAEKLRRCRELALGPVVVSATEALGLRQTETQALLGWRRLTWPITAFANPERQSPSIRFGRS
jgi:hypothetical protein